MRELGRLRGKLITQKSEISFKRFLQSKKRHCEIWFLEVKDKQIEKKGHIYNSKDNYPSE